MTLLEMIQEIDSLVSDVSATVSQQKKLPASREEHSPNPIWGMKNDEYTDVKHREGNKLNVATENHP